MQSYISNNKVISTPNIKNTKNVAFKGNLATMAADGATFITKGIENGGFIVDFLCIDFLGMILPRIYIGYNRNRKELGHPNYKAAAEEAIRELLSGPCMFVIPAMVMLLSKKAFGPASNIQFKTLKSLTGSFKGLLEKGATNTANTTKLKENFYKNVMNEVFAEHKKLNPGSAANIDKKINEIVSKISQAELAEKNAPFMADFRNNLAKLFPGKVSKVTTLKTYQDEIKKIVSDLNKSSSLHLDNSTNVTLKDGLTKGINDLVSDMIGYSSDVVKKVAERSASGTPNKLLPKELEDICKVKTNGRKINLASSFLATSGFLFSIPKLYQRSKTYPGVDGLSKNDKESPKQDKITTNQATTPNKKNIKSALSFTGNHYNTKLMQENRNSTPQKPILFGGGSFTDKIFINNDFNKCSAPYTVFSGYLAGVVLTRLARSRDENETRDVLTRDIPSVTTILLALPAFRNITSALSNKAFGFPISKKIDSVLGQLNPYNKPFSFENLDDIYSGINKYKNNIVDFSKNIDNNGGDLRKVFDFLSDDSKAALNNISKELSPSCTTVKSSKLVSLITNSFKAGKSELSLPSSNKEIIEMLEKAQKNGNLNNSLQTVVKEISKEGNHLVKFSHSLKSIPELVSIVTISLFLGAFLPWLNTQNTKKHFKQKNMALNNNEAIKKDKPPGIAGMLHNLLHKSKSSNLT